MVTPVRSNKRSSLRPNRRVYPELSRGEPRAKASAEVQPAADQEAERLKRLQAIDLVFGLWKDRTDIPKDGLAYQEELRAEW